MLYRTLASICFLFLACGSGCGGTDAAPNANTSSGATNSGGAANGLGGESETAGASGGDGSTGNGGDAAECDGEIAGPNAELACRDDCEPKGSEHAEAAVCIKRATGKLIDAQGAPVPKLGVSFCGEVCYGGASDENGNFSIPIYDWYEPTKYSIGPHGSPHLSSFYYQLPADFPGGDYSADEIRLLPLPADGPLLVTKSDLKDGKIPPAQTLTSGGVTLLLGAATVVQLTIGDILDGDEGHRFRALEIEKSLHPEYAPQFNEDARIFAFGPFDASFSSSDPSSSPSVALEIDNATAWASDSSVEVFALGTYYDDEWVVPHTFGSIGTAKVSSDGSKIEFLDDTQGLGLRNLTWIALVPE